MPSVNLDPRQLVQAARAGEFESRASLLKDSLYALERRVGHLFFRAAPPASHGLRMLNLGCGSLRYPDWCNADDYAFKRSLREKSFRPDWRLDVTQAWKCRSDFWDGVFCQHVIEHLRYSQAAFALGECLRTMKPGAWLRLSVPSLSRYVAFYEGRLADPAFARFPHKALAMSFLAQMHHHKSTWDAGLMIDILLGLGFARAREVAFMEGSDPRLIRDQPEKSWESVYVEAQKPA